MGSVERVKSYVEGKLTLTDFYNLALNDDELQGFLQDSTSVPPYTNEGDLFSYTVGLDTNRPGSDLNLKDALSKRLTQLAVDHEMDVSAGKEYEFFLGLSPKWLSLPDFYIAKLKGRMEGVGSREARRSMAKASIESDFKYPKKPPKWIQSPNWLFAGERPLVFVGQLDLGELMHDIGQVYVFYDPEDNSY